MNIYRLLVLVILLFCQNVVNSSDSNNTDINIYFSSYINSSNGNGTIENPFNSNEICNIYNIFINQGSSSDINTTVIIVNFGAGQYNATNCPSKTISGYSDITIQSYQDNKENSNNIAEIDGLYIPISDSIVTFLKSINISNVILSVQSSVLNFNNISISLQDEPMVILISNLTFTNCILSSPFHYRGPNLQPYQSRLLFSNSTIFNIDISFSTDPNQSTYTGLYISDSRITKSILSMVYYNFQFDNSEWIDTILFTKTNSTITNSNISTFSNFGPNYPQAVLFSISFDSSRNSKFICKNTSIEFQFSTYGLLNSIMDSVGNSNIEFSNVSISGYQNSMSVFAVFSPFIATDLKIKNCVSSSLIVAGFTNVEFNQLTVIGNTFYSLISAEELLELKVGSTRIQCNQNNQINEIVAMNYVENGNNSITMVFSNFYTNCVGTYTFKNASVIFKNVEIVASFSQNYISLFGEYSLLIVNSKIISNSLNDYSVLIAVSDQSSTTTGFNGIRIIGTTIENSSSGILSSANCDSVIINNCTFSNIVINSSPVIKLSNSNLQIISTTFRHTSSNLIVSDNSIISITNSIFENVGPSIISNSTYNSITISNSTILNCFTLSVLFSMDNGLDIQITNTLFKGNHGYGYKLFVISQYDNVVFRNCTFIDNSFSPMISSNQSNVLMVSNVLINFVGSFYFSEYDESSIIDQFNYNQNNIPVEYLFGFGNSTIVKFLNVNITNNYLVEYLFFAISIGDIELNNIIVQNNTIVSSITFPLILENNDDNQKPHGLFIFVKCGDDGNGMIKLNQIQALNNDFSSSLFYLYTSVMVDVNSSTFSNNKLSFSSLFYNTYSDLLISNSIINQNKGVSSLSLIQNDQCNLTIDNCQVTNNQLNKNGYGEGSIAYFQTTYYYFYFKITNSIFLGNNAQRGGVFSIDGYEKITEIDKYITFENNQFISNSAIKGGVVNSDGFAFSNNMTHVFIVNTFINNSALYGNEFSSLLSNGEFTSNRLNVVAGIETLIGYRFLDYYGNVYTPFLGLSSFRILKKNSTTGKFDKFSSFSKRVNAGQGEFYQIFYGNKNDEYLIKCLGDYGFSMVVVLENCLPFQTFNSLKGSCSYCQIGYSTIEPNGECVECNSEYMTCLDNIVYSQPNYYMINQDISNVKQCTMDTCNSNNTCINQLNTGLLCFNCIDPDSDNIGSGITIPAKNGIQCCKYFNPLLLIPLVIVFLIFGLMLSWFKYNGYKSSFNSIVLFIQINSIVFFSYNGIYILPLFRLSIDMLDGYCLFKSLNFNHKSILSFSIIISLFLIGSTDVSLYLLKNLFGKRIAVDHIGVKYPNFIQKVIISKERSKIHETQSIWSLIQLLFIIPLIFNSLLSVVSKNINYIKYLAIDFTIDYNNSSLYKLIYIISLFSFISISILILFIIFISFLNIKIGDSFYNNFKSLQLNLYKKSYKWWDLIIILKSIIYCLLSVLMLFNSLHLLEIIISIQLVYSISYFLLNPLKSIKNQFKDINNFINLLQLIILIIMDSTLLNLSTPHHKGIVITCLTISSIVLILLYKHFYLNIKKIIIKPPKYINLIN